MPMLKMVLRFSNVDVSLYAWLRNLNIEMIENDSRVAAKARESRDTLTAGSFLSLRRCRIRNLQKKVK